jgi:hypothetical protein
VLAPFLPSPPARTDTLTGEKAMVEKDLLSEDQVIAMLMDDLGFTKEQAILALASPTFPKPAIDDCPDHETN